MSGEEEIPGADKFASATPAQIDRRPQLALDPTIPGAQCRPMFYLIGNAIGLLGFLAAMLWSLELGRRCGRKRLHEDEAGSHRGVGALEGAVFGLMGLLIAFTFSGAASRFDARRELLLKEANAIGTTWLRLDLLGAPARETLRAELRRYVDFRLEETRAGAGDAAPSIATEQRRIWTQAVAATRDSGDVRATTLLLPALNEMFDVATARYLAAQTHPPGVIYAMLVTLALGCAALAGYGMAAGKRRSWLHIGCFTGSLLLAIYVTMDLEFPRRGFIRIDRYDRLLVEVRESMR